MIQHVVMWKFKKDTQEQMQAFLEGLKGLEGQIPQLKSMRVGVSCNEENTFDAVLISEFESMQDLQVYQSDPRHIKVSALCKAIRLERAAVDFVIEASTAEN